MVLFPCAFQKLHYITINFGIMLHLELIKLLGITYTSFYFLGSFSYKVV